MFGGAGGAQNFCQVGQIGRAQLIYAETLQVSQELWEMLLARGGF